MTWDEAKALARQWISERGWDGCPEQLLIDEALTEFIFSGDSKYATQKDFKSREGLGAVRDE
jgi:hypothetical protein